MVVLIPMQMVTISNLLPVESSPLRVSNRQLRLRLTFNNYCNNQVTCVKTNQYMLLQVKARILWLTETKSILTPLSFNNLQYLLTTSLHRMDKTAMLIITSMEFKRDNFTCSLSSQVQLQIILQLQAALTTIRSMLQLLIWRMGMRMKLWDGHYTVVEMRNTTHLIRLSSAIGQWHHPEIIISTHLLLIGWEKMCGMMIQQRITILVLTFVKCNL